MSIIQNYPLKMTGYLVEVNYTIEALLEALKNSNKILCN